MKIAIIGTHGTGKTTLAYHIAAEAKSRGYNARLINEVARDCPFPLNENFDLQGAQWIVSTQIQKELQAQATKSNFIVCDRSSIDPLMYLKNAYKHEFDRNTYADDLFKFAYSWMDTYNKIFWVVPSSHDIIDDGVRSTDKEFQKNIHELFAMNDSYLNTYLVENSLIIKKEFEQVYLEIFK